jgi:hypothetical protein
MENRVAGVLILTLLSACVPSTTTPAPHLPTSEATMDIFKKPLVLQRKVGNEKQNSL